MLPLKINYLFFYPKTELVGVFITAWAVSICYALVQQPDLNCGLLFFATLGYYSIDHFFDLRRIKQANLTVFTGWYLALIVISALAFAGLMVLHGFASSFNGFMHKFWPTTLIGAIYFALRFWGNGRFTAIMKWFLISLSVGFAINFPAADLETAMPVLVCLCNVMAFSFLERKKDEGLGNVNLFNAGLKKGVIISFLLMVSGAGIIMAWFYNVPRGWGAAVYGVLVLLICSLETKFRQNTYRWWLDALLPMAFLPFG